MLAVNHPRSLLEPYCAEFESSSPWISGIVADVCPAMYAEDAEHLQLDNQCLRALSSEAVAQRNQTCTATLQYHLRAFRRCDAKWPQRILRTSSRAEFEYEFKALSKGRLGGNGSFSLLVWDPEKTRRETPFEWHTSVVDAYMLVVVVVAYCAASTVWVSWPWRLPKAMRPARVFRSSREFLHARVLHRCGTVT